MFGNKILHATAYAIVAAATVFVLLVGWLLIFPVGPSSTIESITVAPKEAVAGQEVDVKVNYCKTIEGPATSNWTLVTESGPTFYMTPIESDRPVGCDVAVLPMTIPVGAPAGKAHYEIDISRQYNPLHRDTLSAESEEFTIVSS